MVAAGRAENWLFIHPDSLGWIRRYGIACQAPWPAKLLRPRSSGQRGQGLVLLLFLIQVEALEFAAERPGLVEQLPRGGAARHLLGLARVAQPLVAGLDRRGVARRAEGGHGERGAQPPVAVV